MKSITTPYKLPVNFNPNDGDMFYFMGEEERAIEAEIKILTDCYWHVGSATNLSKIKKGWMKILMAKLGSRYHMAKAEVEGAWISDRYSGNYFHWFSDALPKLIYLESKGIKVPVFLPQALQQFSFVRDSLHMLGFTARYYSDKDIIPVQKIFIPDYTALAGSQHPVHFVDMVNNLKKADQSEDVKPWRKIFISRKNSPFRNLEPWQPVQEVLEQTGFEIIETDTLSLAEQVKLFKECSHLAAVHGAGLTNMAFMHDGSKVFEIRRQDDVFNYCYYKMAHILRRPYYYFLTYPMNRNKKIQNDNFTVDATALRIALEEFIS